jgi:RNA 2',3'-cyclic 3'-phosphodiesterase
MNHSFHYFFALSLPSNIKEQIREWMDSYKIELSFYKWVHQEDYHLTLAFLGAATDDQLYKVTSKMEEALAMIPSFPLTISHLGTFGNQPSPRIFWIGVNEEERLHQIREKVYQVCEQVGFPLDKRPFRPHITVARKWIGDHPFSIKLVQQTPSKTMDWTFQADTVTLYRTHMNRLPKYEAVWQKKLSFS